jgi:outer membrane protein assembly factor BamA
VAGDEVTDQLVQGRATLATPVLARVLRVVAAGNVGFLYENTRKRYFAVGGDNGLRGYPVGEFVGTGAEFIGHIEARSMALKLAFLRLGGLLFFDAGDAAADAGSLTFYDDVGFGLRLLIPQLNTYALRADWAFPLRPAPGMPAGWPGRMSFGFRQVF